MTCQRGLFAEQTYRSSIPWMESSMGFLEFCNTRMAFSVTPIIHGLGGSPQGQVTRDLCFARIDSGVNIPWPVFALVCFPGSGHSHGE